MIACQACGQPGGEGASVRLRDITYSLMSVGGNELHLVSNGLLDGDVPLCWKCASSLTCCVYTKSAANGQEEGCDD